MVGEHTNSRFSYFITVAEIGNITRAAQILRVSQPSLSQYLTRLESGLGVRLLDRSCTPIQLTEAGKAYLHYVKRVIAEEKALEEALEQIRAGATKKVMIGIPSQLIPTLFERHIRGFADKHPEIELRIKEGSSLQVRKMLLEGKVDMAIFHTTERDETCFVRRVLQEETLYLATNADNPFVCGKARNDKGRVLLSRSEVASLASMQVVTVGQEYLLHKLLMSYLNEIGVAPKRIMEIPNVRALGEYISQRDSNSITMLPDYLFKQLACTDRIVRLEVPAYTVKWYLTANYVAGTELPYATWQLWADLPKKTAILPGTEE